jgi:hypothetical protein
MEIVYFDIWLCHFLHISACQYFQLGCLSVWGFDSSQIIFLTGILFLETVDYCKKNIDQLVAGYVSAFYFHQQMIKVLNLMFLTFFFHYNVHLHGVSSLY